MKIFFAVCLAALLFAACSSSKKNSSSRPTTTEGASFRDGSSYDKAIVIVARNEKSGVAKEYEWIKRNYPRYTSNGQSLDKHNGKPYDIIHIVTSVGKNRDIYFDISKFFGK